MPADRFSYRRVDRQFQPGGQDHCPKHPNWVLDKSFVRVADASDSTASDISHAVDVIENRAIGSVIEERVDCEVAPERILFGCSECVITRDEAPCWPAGGRCITFGPFPFGLTGRTLSVGFRWHLLSESRHFECFLAELDVGQPEPTSDDPAVLKQSFNLLWVCGCAEIKIFRASVQ